MILFLFNPSYVMSFVDIEMMIVFIPRNTIPRVKLDSLNIFMPAITVTSLLIYN